MEISYEIFREFKDRMKISHKAEDSNLMSLLSSSMKALNQSCGTFDWSNEQGKELVFERARYAYNDSLEFFADNFLTEIVNLSISLLQTNDQEEGDSG